ncbi:chaperone protein DnaJ [Vitis riparia]|uniref:chaperone protein DnaJ n=1 Tax=Vitis riparia TaxID=96939 RepID=UPI00155B1D06|nr:chaperone protein DnaJ [Vitis riparia]
MGDPPRSPTPDFYSILGISRGASILDVCKAYKSLAKKWHPDKNPSNKPEAQAKFQAINEAYKALNKEEEKTTMGADDSTTPKGSYFHLSMDDGFFQLPSFLSKSSSRRSHTPPRAQTPTRFGVSLSKSASRRNSIPTDFPISPSTTTPTWTSSSPADFPSSPSDGTPNRRSTTPTSLSKSASRQSTTPNSLSKSASRRSNSAGTSTDFAASLSKSTSRRSTTPIIYSQSTVRRKPQPIEKKLECTLEELCHGCNKKIKITRDVISDIGLIVQEEEILRIQIKPGWRQGTKVKFDGRGDERPGTLPADIIFLIDEKRHPIFKRVGDNLEIGVEIPLVKAITGCPLSVPLLGGEKMSLFIDDIIYHGYEKIIPGQGMPMAKQEGRRGDLKIKFLVSFPTELSDQQRSDVYRILQDSS